MTISFYVGERTRESSVRITPTGITVKNEVVEVAKKYTFREDRTPRLEVRGCTRQGWDDETGRNEACGSLYHTGGCKCHPEFCPDCSAETHGISITLPGVMENSSLLNHCSTKGNHG